MCKVEQSVRIGIWTRMEDGPPPDDTYCIIQYADGSMTAAVTASSWVNGFFTKHKWITPTGKRKFKDTNVPAKPIAWFIVPTSPFWGQEPLSKPGRCAKPPAGWWCSREAAHDGPCAARELSSGW